MAKLQRNFIKGKMNKSLDERLVPNGEYIDALNVRIGSTELSEIGAVENSKGNIKLTTLTYDTGSNYIPLSNSAKCIGAFEDSANETIYWFVTDPANTGPQATSKLDLIVSYNTNTDSITYHVVSVDDGGGVNTTLNFNSAHLITGVDKIDDLLFFTDNYNQPRVVNVTRSYLSPSSNIDGGSIANALILAESLLVIKKPPINSPTYELVQTGNQQNFLEDRFICFAYRYRYEDDMYSATSQFTNPAFSPKIFNYNGGSFLNEGMINVFDTAVITFNTGGPLVVGIDLLFKEASNPVIRIIEKLNKSELNYSDNQNVTYTFSNNKIYSLLDDNEILRLYDNVPLKAKAQTVMGKRLMYGNYMEGYDVSGVHLDYTVEYLYEDIGLKSLTTSTGNGDYNIDPAVLGGHTQSNSKIDIGLDGIPLVSGTRIAITVNFSHGSFTSEPAAGLPATSQSQITFTYILQQNFATAQDLHVDTDFRDKVGPIYTVTPILDACNGVTFTDLLNCKIPVDKVDGNGLVWTKTAGGIDNTGEGAWVLASLTPTTFLTNFVIQLPATVYTNGGVNAYEYYTILSAQAHVLELSDPSSLHSDRDYEIGIIYMDEYNRSTTVLVSPQNMVHIPCSQSDTKNTIRVEIPPTQRPPTWATRYKLAIKQDKDLYETVYSDFYFSDDLLSIVYVLLEGENAQKIKEGDVLRLKTNVSGALQSCEEVTVSQKKAQEEGWITATFADGSELRPPAGVYAEFKSSSLSPPTAKPQFINLGDATVSVGNGTHPIIAYPINFTGDENAPTWIDENLAEGDTIRIDFTLGRFEQQGWIQCPKRVYRFDKTYTVSQAYTNFKSWWDGDNIALTLADGTEDVGVDASYPFIHPQAPKTLYMQYDPSIAPNKYDFGVSAQVFGILMSQGTNLFRFTEDGSGRKYLNIASSSSGCSFQNSVIYVHIEIQKAKDILIFETSSQDAAPDIFYESSVSYPITGGFHTGNFQTQTASLPAIIDTDFMNCFAFGNGAESYKIRDSITRNSFGLGNRVSAVLEGEDYREVHRFADITYSGTYGYNVNNLNEFNLGLLNFKVLEPSFGEIQKLFARATDILTLQEDKISYVLAGKNLLSDAAAGGVVTSVPEVLGTQIARIEEYGIGNNPESFAQYGYDKYFTDSKRGVVIQLKGSAYSNEQLNVISDFGMSSWFRDLFLADPNTQKLGGFDPYMKEYVLSANNILLPTVEEETEAGLRKRVSASESQSVSFVVDLGKNVGDCTMSYNVISITGEFKLIVTYNSVLYPNPPGYEALTSVGSGSFVVPKATVLPKTATVEVQYFSGGANAKIELDVKLSSPATTTLNVIQVCLSDNKDQKQTIHNEYRWTLGTFVSGLNSNFVSLAEGTTAPLISEYKKTTGPQGDVAPVDTSTVELISHKYQSDDFAFDSAVNNFGYLRSATLYPNTPAGVLNILNDAGFVSVPGAGGSGVFSGSFTMPSGSANDNLYLIYDYRKPVSITLCYSNTSAADACCTCGTSGTYYLDAPTLAEATAVYTSAALDTKATDGWYSTGGFVRKQTSGLLEINSLCSACKLSCATTLSMDTLPGVYTVEVELGSGTGAVVVDIDFKTYPDGFKIVYNGITYNDIYSLPFGFINSPGTYPVYAGITAFDCSISGTTFFLKNYQFNGNGFNDAGTNQSVTVDPTSVFLKSSGLGTCKMIIPKTAASPSTAVMTIISPCDKSEVEVTVGCPTALTAFTTTRAAPEATNIVGLCGSVTPTSFYNVPVGGTAGNPGLGDIIYQDANGSTLAAAGFYGVVGYPAGSGVIQLDANGTVASIVACI